MSSALGAVIVVPHAYQERMLSRKMRGVCDSSLPCRWCRDPYVCRSDSGYDEGIYGGRVAGRGLILRAVAGRCCHSIHHLCDRAPW